VFHNTTSDLQDQDQDHSVQDQHRFFWSQTGLVLRPTVSDYITVGRLRVLDRFSPKNWWKGGMTATEETIRLQWNLDHGTLALGLGLGDGHYVCTSMGRRH